MTFRDELIKIVETQKSITKGSEIAKQTLSKEVIEEAEYEAEPIISMIKDHCIKAAMKEESKVVISIINIEDIKGNRTSDISVNPHNTKGLEKILSLRDLLIVEAIIDLSLTPTIKYQHDGSGTKNWFNIIASWDQEKLMRNRI